MMFIIYTEPDFSKKGIATRYKAAMFNDDENMHPLSFGAFVGGFRKPKWVEPKFWEAISIISTMSSDINSSRVLAYRLNNKSSSTLRDAKRLYEQFKGGGGVFADWSHVPLPEGMQVEVRGARGGGSGGSGGAGRFVTGGCDYA